jgi:hypothetical protein
VQVGFFLAFQGEVVSQMLGADHILQHGFIIGSEAEYNKRRTEDRVLRVKGEDPQCHVWPVSLAHEALKLLMHQELIANPALQDRLVEHD